MTVRLDELQPSKMVGVRLFISAGEASGDAYGAAIVRALRDAKEVAPVEAIGGRKLREAGASIVVDSSTWGTIGIVQALTIAPKVTLAYYRVKRILRQGEPGLLVPIDFGAFNIRLARFAKRIGWKVLYFVPPGSWNRERQGADLPKVADAIVTPFEWSAQILEQMGANVHWFGHPIKSLASAGLPDGQRSEVAVLPGSRKFEIRHNMPSIAKAVTGLPPLEFAVASTVDASELQRTWQELSGRTEDRFTTGDAGPVLGRARAAIVCSGTATLQAAIARCPMVVIYRWSNFAGLQIKLFRLDKKIKFISLPNILLDRPAVPELLQDGATPEAIRTHLDRLLAETPERRAQLEAFEEIDRITGPSDCIARTAELILAFADA